MTSIIEGLKRRPRGKAGSLPAFMAAWIMTASGMILHAEKRDIDTRRSEITVHVYKAGLFSAFGHDHTITAPVARGYIQRSDVFAVELWVDAGKLRVIDADLSARDRAEVQQTMEGADVLDVRRYPEIHFRSTAVEPGGTNRWMVRGDLDLHGQTRPVAVEIREQAGWFEGSLALKQRDFGMEPVSIAGGTVKVKDQVRLDFKISAVQ